VEALEDRLAPSGDLVFLLATDGLLSVWEE
jgi:hypothetical protein